MNQSFDTEVQVVLRALEDTVLPALAGAERHVVEQMHLSMVALGFIQARLPLAGRFYRSELVDFADMATDAADLIEVHNAGEADTLRATADDARELLERPQIDDAVIVAATRDLRAAIAAAVERSAVAPYAAALDRLIVEASTPVHLRTRAFYLPFGLEQQPDELPPLIGSDR